MLLDRLKIQKCPAKALVCFDAVVLWWPDSGRDMLVENQDLIRFRGENNGESLGTHRL